MSIMHSFLLFTLLSTVLAVKLPQTNRLFFDDSASLPQTPSSLPRQNFPPGTCPFPGLSCTSNQLCCPNYCCPAQFPNCLDNGCINDVGQVPCGSYTTPGTICGDYCCPGTTFNRCPAQNLPLPLCLTGAGYVSCGGKPGVLCSYTTKICCQNPKRCCDSDPSGCCNTGNGMGPFPIAPLVQGYPAITPFRKEPIDTPTPSPESENEPSKSQLPTPSPDTAPGVDEVGEGSDISITTIPTPTAPAGLTPGNAEEERSCFPGDATVQLKSGAVKRMRDITTGDIVRVGENDYSEIFMWTHQDSRRKGSYVQLSGRGGENLTAAAGHLVYICRKMQKGCDRETAPIENVKEGDGMWVVGKGVVEVTSVGRGDGLGLYNPHTVKGDIVVNGVVCSCYTKFVDYRTAHSLLAPLRAIHEILIRCQSSFSKL